MRVLAPPRDWQPNLRQANNDSLVMEIQYGSTSALLAGDVEKKVERELARTLALNRIHADLLKVAHHGSGTSTTPELLASARPQYAVISAGFRNSFGHPRAEVLQRLEAAHVVTYRTDTLGAVTFLLDGKTISAATH